MNLALQKLNAARDEVKVTVVSKGHPGILGIGAQEATVEVKLNDSPLTADISELQLAKQVVEELLHKLEIEAEVEIRNPDTTLDDEGAAPLIVDIEGEDLGALIGRHGQAMAALQYLTQVIINKRTASRRRVVIDINGYRARRTNTLCKMATDAAERVTLSRHPFSLPPMSAYERRMVHLTLANSSSVTTHSVGTGNERHVIISPKGGTGRIDIPKRKRQGGL